MKQHATVTSKGQITIPAEVRRALELDSGDQVVFEIEEEDNHRVARFRPAADFLSMAGSIPPKRRGSLNWAEERRIAREEQARRRRL